MSEEQRSLAGYKSPAHKQGDFDDVNIGKPALDDSTEYILSLRAIPKVKKMPVDKEDKNTGEKKKVLVDKAICEFVEESTKNIVVTFLKIESLNFSDEGKYESAVVTFFKKIKRPLPPDQDVEDWTQHFVLGMRFRSRVVIKQKLNKDGTRVNNYYLDIPTCRPILPSDMHPEAAATLNNQDAAATLANAVFLAKGAKDFHEAMAMLEKANAPKDIVMALFQAHQDGKVKFPL
jgi:hypothetical protein